MSHTAALLVPVGVPRPRPRVHGYKAPWHQSISIDPCSSDNVPEAQESDKEAWVEDDEASASTEVYSATWYHAYPPTAHASEASGSLRFAVGETDGSISIFARPVHRYTPTTEEERPSSSLSDAKLPSPTQTEPTTGPMTRRKHRRNLQMLVAGMMSTESLASAISNHSHTGSNVPSMASSSLASPMYNSQNATIGVSSENAAPAVLKESSDHAAEDLLEAQYHATDMPRVIEHPHLEHPHYVPHTHTRMEKGTSSPNASYPKLQVHAAPASSTPSSPRVVSDTVSSTPVSAPEWNVPPAPFTCIQRLFSPDSTPVTALVVDDTPASGYAPPLLVVQQASGRIIAWNRVTLDFIGTMLVREQTDVPEDQVGVVLEHQEGDVSEPIHSTVATFTFTHPRNETISSRSLGSVSLHIVRLSDDTPFPYLVVQWSAWPHKALLLCVDIPRHALLPSAMLDLPSAKHEKAPVAWGLYASTLHMLSTHADGTCMDTTFAIQMQTWTQSPTQEESIQAPRPEPRHFLTHASRRRRHLLATPPPNLHAPAGIVSQGHVSLGSCALDHVTATTLTPQLWAVAAVSAETATLYLLDRDCQAPMVTVALPSPARRIWELYDRFGVECEAHVLTIRVLHDGAHLDVFVENEQVLAPSSLAAPLPSRLWPVAVEEPAETSQDPEEPGWPWALSATLPLTLGRIVLANDQGGLAVTSLVELLNPHPAWSAPAAEAQPTWQAPISALQVVANPRTGTRHLLGGSVLGDVGVWDVTTLRMEAAWSWFTSPVQAMVPFAGIPTTSRLFGCVLCVARDGTSALLALDDVRLVQLFPGCDQPLTHAAVQQNQLVLIYGQRHVRLWDLSTNSLNTDVPWAHIWKTIRDPETGWHLFVVPTLPRTLAPSAESLTGMLSPCGSAQMDAVGLFLADVRRAVESATKALRTAMHLSSLLPWLDSHARAWSPSNSSSAGPAPTPSNPLQREGPGAVKLAGMLRPLLPLFVPTALDPVFALDNLPEVHTVPGCSHQHGYLSMATMGDARTRFTTSPDTSAQHLLVAVSLCLLLSSWESKAHSMLSALLTPSFMAQSVGDAYIPPALSIWTQYILDENEVLRTAAKLLFYAYIENVCSDELSAMEQSWRPHLPTETQPATSLTPMAVLFLGLLCAEKYAYFSPALLKQVATMVVTYLEKPEPHTLQAYLALELCSTGFHVWQHYIDTVSLVRHIFRIATEPDDATPNMTLNGLSLRGLARRATLALASKHSALFMSTLAMDILHAPSVAQSQVTMRLVAFMVHQKPLVLYPSLPRLVEAVVKSLDPTLGQQRSSLAQAATVMIKELVQTYPSIAFHGPSQRLAVGTSDGPIVMYDLKSATRLYVLDGHTRGVTACSFSPDGRHILSLSLDEEVVLLWRLSTGFMGMLRRSQTPDSTAYRAIQVHLGAAAQLPPADTLTCVAFEWRDAHSVQLRVGEAHVNVGLV